MNDKIKGVFFDLYGTLLVYDDYDKSDNVWINTFYDLVGKTNNLSIDSVRQICQEILDSNIEKESANGLTTYETKIKKGFEKFGINFTKDELKNLADNTVGTWQVHIRLADDAIKVLNEFKKNKKVVLITNFDHSPHIKKVIAQTGLDAIFDLVVISDEAGCKKPDLEIFRLALSKMNLSPDEVVYVGDNVYDDIEGAFSAGIKPILISRNNKSHSNNNTESINSNKKSLPEFQKISSLSELIPLLS
jgi:putative hydrolase of the HAD superfamily